MIMELKELFAQETARAVTDQVKEIIYQRPELYEEVLQLVLKNEEPYSRRAIWVFDAVDEELGEVAAPFLPQLIGQFDHFGHDALRRHTLRILSRHEIPEAYQVRVIDTCFKMLQMNVAAAIKVHAMQVLYNLSQQQTGLKHELISALELNVREGCTGVKNRGNRLLKKLKKEIHGWNVRQQSPAS